MQPTKRLIASAFLIHMGLSFLASGAHALDPCAPIVGELTSVQGEVEIQRAATPRWQAAVMGDQLCEGDAVRAGRLSRAAIALINQAVLRLDQNTTLQLVDITAEEEERSLLELVVGAIQSFSRSPRLLAVNTPYLNATVEGTEFFVEVAADRSSVIVYEGIVSATNPEGELRLASGAGAVAEAGQPPRALMVVRPRDAVQWALYYPPIFAALGGRGVSAPGDLPPPLAAATERANEGDISGALEILERVPEAERDTRHHTYRAALLLSVGRIAEARTAIDRALALDPDAGLAHAQRAIIALVQDQREQALADAERAVELAPEATAPKIALSYAQQGNFQLEAARDTLLRAVEQNPDDPLAWARLAELWLMLGYRDRAREAAERAVALAPDLQRTQNVLGFASLVEFDTAAAKAAFERAIALDPADPLPRLGLGLAQIRESSLEEGRRNLEVAVSLDSGDALLRAYLGKAYFEETRDDLANEQFQMAQELDPLDPTAYLYEAIKQQTENRPGEALQNLQRSIELNDNRAVYRSRLLLDADRAARGTSLARIYDDLGFTQLGQNEASHSLKLDPTNASAHRFLSDIYRDVRRRESARVSELLQAQMLQDININPVQPSISETNLNIVTQGGPADAGFNEFTPLFERQRAQVNASGAVGNNDTYGGEGVVSMLYDRYSLSAGALHFETDGWRDNHDIEHNIGNVFFQAAITPELNAQVELTQRATNTGDLALNFDPDDFEQKFQSNLDQKSARVGLRYSPLPSSDFLLSAIYAHREDQQTLIEDTIFGPSEFDGKVDDEGYQLEGQYLFRQDWFNLTAGTAFSEFDTEDDISITSIFGPIDDQTSSEATHVHPYVYGNVNLPEPVTWTAGLAYDDFEQEETDVNKLSPKFGAQWKITDDLLLRGAVFHNVKPLLANNRSLEPTQVAGFNQLYDEANGTEAWRYGIGLDHSLTDDLWLGTEATWRDITVPAFGQTLDHDEQTHRAYAYWTPLDEVALTLEFVYDRFEAESSVLTLQGPVPEDVETFSVPLGIRYFHPSGFFAGFTGTYVNQEVDRTPGQEQGLSDGDGDFFVLDAAIGYRLPRRLGLISLQVSNILDQGFRYQDDSFREFEDAASIGPYIPERQILARVTLNW